MIFCGKILFSVQHGSCRINGRAAAGLAAGSAAWPRGWKRFPQTIDAVMNVSEKNTLPETALSSYTY